MNFENANKQTVTDSSDMDSRHIELTFLKFSSFYIFVPFKHIKKSNALGLVLVLGATETPNRNGVCGNT